MVKKVAKHARHYTPLLGIFTVSILGFLFFKYDRVFQVSVVISAAISYIAWGIIHHKIHDDLDIFVALEYVGVATLGLIIVFSMIFRA